MATVASEEVAAYQDMVEALAYRYVNNDVGCEYDDLVQEGLIAVWRSLDVGQPPSTQFIKSAMRFWRTRVERQRRGDPIAKAYVFLDPDALEGRPVHSQRSRKARRELLGDDSS